MLKSDSKGSERGHVGLCGDCKHMRPIESDRGARFFLCLRSASDPHFPKYPTLPRITCPGYEQGEEKNLKS